MTEHIDMPEPERKVLVAGDWHGNYRHAEATIEHAYRKGADAIIQLGDFGFWLGWDCPQMEAYEYLTRVEQAAQNYGVRVYWLDGNHEYHPARLTGEFNDPARPMTTYLPRGHRWTWWGKRFMAVGGAFSVDRFARTEGVSWWPEEILTVADVAHASRDDGTSVDVIFAHDCPLGVNIPRVGPDSITGSTGGWPRNMLAQSDKHRTRVRTVWEATHPALWYHGHYHIPYQAWYGPTRFFGLGADGDGVVNSVELLEPGSLG